MYLGDISGAFDGVVAPRLLHKLRRLDACDKLLTFFYDFLAPRLARVAVDGYFSLDFALQNMVF